MEKKIKALKQRIRSRISSLTDSQKLIANFIVENPQKFALSSVRELEQELNVSKSTIVRLAQALGYNGFLEMKTEFLNVIRSELDPLRRFKSLYSGPIPDTDYLQLIFEESSTNLQTTLRLLDKDQFKKAVSLLESAQHVYTIGLGISYYMADIAAYLLNRVSVRATALRVGGFTFAEQLVNLSSRDVVMAFSFLPYSQETVEAASFAHEKGMPVIAFTDKATSKIVPYSEVVLQVGVDSLTISNSMVSVMALLYALIGQIGHEMKDKTLQTIEKIEYVRREHSAQKNDKLSKFS